MRRRRRRRKSCKTLQNLHVTETEMFSLLDWIGFVAEVSRCLTVIHCLNSELLNNLHTLNFETIPPNADEIVVFNFVLSVKSGKTSPRNVCSISCHCVLQCLAKCIDLPCVCVCACGCACANGALNNILECWLLVMAVLNQQNSWFKVINYSKLVC